MSPPRTRAWQAAAGGALGGLSLAAARTFAGKPVGSAPTLTAGAVGLGTSGLMVHQWLSARSWLYGEVFWRARTAERVVALTFDDGPCHPYTGELLAVLEREGVRATFFMPGANVRREPQLAAEVAAGHAVGNHAYSHPCLVWRGRSKAWDEIRRAQEEIHGATGVRPGVFRAPRGWYGPQVISAAEELGLRCVGWSVMAWDWNRPPPETIERRILRGIRPGAVSLLHDGQDISAYPLADRSRTIAAVPRIIRRLKAEGYSFSTVPELIAVDAAASRDA